MYTVVYVLACVVHAYVCLRTCVRAYLCVLAQVEGLKTPFLLVSFLPKRGPKLFVPLGALSDGLGGFPGLSPLLKINQLTPMRASRGPCDLVI